MSRTTILSEKNDCLIQILFYLGMMLVTNIVFLMNGNRYFSKIRQIGCNQVCYVFLVNHPIFSLPKTLKLLHNVVTSYQIALV
ncbi:hypothetical protein HanXRQr2_Chr01g0010901 [Helianthus annuus]|uniref:Uncharacterized protein n=1 Tax=Helianthus annuus TaxID=4232 RepID=A0A251VN07_HELAN|nr:hypothetical protein HanXRQr2_Chr01g0010901 [Helianthus annuus]